MNDRKTINDQIRNLARSAFANREAYAVRDDVHARLWAEHREAVMRSWWAFRTAGHVDTIAIVIDGAITTDGKPVATVVRVADALAVLSAIRDDMRGGVPIELTFRDALRPDPVARRLLVVSGAPGAGLDVIAQDDLMVTSRGGDA